MQPGHEEVALAPEELSSAPELEELLLDESSLLFLAHEMMVKVKKEIRIICKIFFI